jgi:uncharacterized membrane protein (UPF0127 family)
MAAAYMAAPSRLTRGLPYAPPVRRSSSRLPLLLVGSGLVLVVAAAGVWLVPRLGVPTRFWSSPIETVRVGERSLRVVVSQDDARGLMGVDDLGVLDGMLFAFPKPLTAPDGMWMRNVPIPLDVAFFDASAHLIEVQTMVTCSATCPIYPPSRPAAFAIEGRAGGLGGLTAGSTLVRER